MHNFSEENKACTICMENYEIEETYMVLPCFHRFHSHCVLEWFKRKNICPNCKYKVNNHFKDMDPSQEESD